MTNLMEDVATLTCVSEHVLKKFIDVSNNSICHAVYENQCEKQNITVIDMGIGELHIKLEDTSIYYKFIPSEKLENMLIKTVTTKTCPLITRLETKIQDKIERAYKELL